jgi:hypothetical protein
MKTATKPELLSIEFITREEEQPDLSYLGKWSARPGPDDRTIDRREHKNIGRHQCEYFIAAMSGDDTGNPESVMQDWKRMEDYEDGEWRMVSIYATAQFRLTEDGPVHTIRSCGLWGIESDSGDEYFAEVKAEELEQLRTELHALGFEDDEIDEAAGLAE